MIKTYALTGNKDVITNRAAIAVMGVLFFLLATALGAYVRIPVGGSPVPITLQTFFVLMSGAVIGCRLGAIAQFYYACLSAPFLSGPTGGYFIGFIAASYIVGLLLERGSPGIGRAIFSFAAGNVIIYLFGISWLAYLFGVGPVKAFLWGALPFIPGDIAKLLVAAVIYSGISGRSKKIFSL